MVDAAALLGVPTLCMQTGMPLPNMSRIRQIKEVVPKVYAPIIAYAKEKGIKIAIENWFETCLQGIDTFECLLETIKDDNFGLNYDPSHLVHQQCNYLLPIRLFAMEARIAGSIGLPFGLSIQILGRKPFIVP